MDQFHGIFGPKSLEVGEGGWIRQLINNMHDFWSNNFSVGGYYIVI